MLETAHMIFSQFENVTKRDFPKEFFRIGTSLCDVFEQQLSNQYTELNGFEWYEEHYGETNDVLFKEVFENYRFNQKNRILARKVTYNWLVSSSKSSRQTGIVISGFGHEDIYPKTIRLSIDGAFKNQPRITAARLIDIEEELENGRKSARIINFAQADVSKTFIEGLAPDNQIYIEQYFENSMRSFANEVLKSVGAAQTVQERKVSKALIKKAIKKFSERQKLDFSNFRRGQHIHPLLEVIDNLPKEEMANVAEAMIELTSLKRRVSNDLESVGGPVDVAILSKSDGFVWMRRKHYFPENINKGFSMRQDRLTTLDTVTEDET